MRHKKVAKKQLAPDWKYSNILVHKFINYVMRRGKKTIAEKVVYGAFDLMTEKAKKQGKEMTDPIEMLDAAIKNISPQMEVKSRRVGGANYQIPIPVRAERRMALVFRWIIEAAQNKKGATMAQRLADELFAAANNEGEAVKKKIDMHRMAEANRAFAHFAR